MRLVNRKLLEKLKRKNAGSAALARAIDILIDDIKSNEWNSWEELKRYRPDADRVHSDGFYFFNLNIHRTMILIEFSEKEATVVWAGTHQEYERKFKNNKSTIKN